MFVYVQIYIHLDDWSFDWRLKGNWIWVELIGFILNRSLIFWDWTWLWHFPYGCLWWLVVAVCVWTNEWSWVDDCFYFWWFSFWGWTGCEWWTNDSWDMPLFHWSLISISKVHICRSSSMIVHNSKLGIFWSSSTSIGGYSSTSIDL